MNKEQLKQLWQRTFGDTPNDEVIALAAYYSDQSEEHEKTLLWLLMTSTMEELSSEADRILWVAQRLKAHYDGAPLPGFKDVPTLA